MTSEEISALAPQNTAEEERVRTVMSKDGTAIAFDQSGGGVPIILVAGAFTDRSHPLLAHLAEMLAPHFTVFNYDRRGRGDSGDALPYAVEREIEDLDALIQEAGGSACVCGFSSGAALALEAARGLAVKKLALYEPPYRIPGGANQLPQHFATHLERLVSSGRRGDAAEYFMVQGAGMPAEAVAGMRTQAFWPMVESAAHTLVYDTAVMGTDARLLPERLKAVAVPTLVIDGGASPEWMRAAARAVAEGLPHAQRRTLQSQTHEVSPLAIAPVLTEFFEG